MCSFEETVEASRRTSLVNLLPQLMTRLSLKFSLSTSSSSLPHSRYNEQRKADTTGRHKAVDQTRRMVPQTLD